MITDYFRAAALVLNVEKQSVLLECDGCGPGCDGCGSCDWWLWLLFRPDLENSKSKQFHRRVWSETNLIVWGRSKCEVEVRSAPKGLSLRTPTQDYQWRYYWESSSSSSSTAGVCCQRWIRVQTKVHVAVKPIELEGIHHTLPWKERSVT